MKKLSAIMLVCAFFNNNLFAESITYIPLKSNIASIEKVLGTKGVYDTVHHVFKINVPRNDLSVSINGVHYVPAENLTTHIMFKKQASQSIINADLVLTEDQANIVMSAALEHDLRVTALHNHFLWEHPRILIMHVEGEGSEAKLAMNIKHVLQKMAETNAGNGEYPIADIDYTASTIKAADMNRIFGAKGLSKNGLYQLEIVSKDDLSENNRMNVMFAGRTELAIMDGELEVNKSELQHTLKILRNGKIDIVAIHQESPSLSAIHFYGLGNAKKMAANLKRVLDEDQKTTRFLNTANVLPNISPLSTLVYLPKITLRIPVAPKTVANNKHKSHQTII